MASNPWILGGAGVVVVALVVVLVLVLTGDDDGPAADRSSVRSTAEAEERARSDTSEPPHLTIEENGTTATATVTVDAGSQGGGHMKLKSVDDGWCVTDFRY
jgi:hypothetical protein